MIYALLAIVAAMIVGNAFCIRWLVNRSDQQARTIRSLERYARRGTSVVNNHAELITVLVDERNAEMGCETMEDAK